MAKWTELPNIWKNVRELDLRPIRREATRPLRLAVAGPAGSRRRALAEELRRDPAKPEAPAQAPVMIAGLDGEVETESPERSQHGDPGTAPLEAADLIILVVGSENAGEARCQDFIQAWNQRGKNVMVFCEDSAGAGSRQAGAARDLGFWGVTCVYHGPVSDGRSLQQEFAPLVMELLPDRLLALARQYPLFRLPVAIRLINDTCQSNAAYSLSTGLAEIVPVLDVPLNITDMMVLTKSQAFLIYRLGLVFGFSTRWQDYVAEFSGVIGGGFVWRQVARSLVGLIPVWGLIPKVAVAYAGTYVVGHTILRWYLTNRQVTPEQVRALYRQALLQGREVARGLIEKLPRPRLGRRQAPAALPDGEARQPGTGIRRFLAARRRPAELPAPMGHACPRCGRQSASDAQFCQYCGKPLLEEG
jgi:uncharacterized protein (DUF697 family)